MRSSSSTCTHRGSADAAFPFSNEAAEGPEPRSNICRSEPERCVSRGTGEAKREGGRCQPWHGTRARCTCVLYTQRDVRTGAGQGMHAEHRAVAELLYTTFRQFIYIFTMRFPSAVTLPSARGETDPSPVPRADAATGVQDAGMMDRHGPWGWEGGAWTRLHAPAGK